MKNIIKSFLNQFQPLSKQVSEKIPMVIVGLSESQQASNYVVILGEQDGNRRLPIIVGTFEAQAIAIAVENMKAPRPLTHDLFKNMMDSHGIELKEIVIGKLIKGVFHVDMMCLKDNQLYTLDARFSDAIAMAVRFNCPIYTYSSILEEAGIELTDNSTEAASSKPEAQAVEPNLDSLSIEELNKQLEELVIQKQYRRAADVQDEINARENNKEV